MPRPVFLSPTDKSVIADNVHKQLAAIHRMLPHLTIYTIRKYRNELRGVDDTQPPASTERGASWSILDASLCARWNRAFSLMGNVGRVCRPF